MLIVRNGMHSSPAGTAITLPRASAYIVYHLSRPPSREELLGDALHRSRPPLPSAMSFTSTTQQQARHGKYVSCVLCRVVASEGTWKEVDENIPAVLQLVLHLLRKQGSHACHGQRRPSILHASGHILRTGEATHGHHAYPSILVLRSITPSI